MRLDGAIFSIEQRTVGGCIDLAIVFFREHFLQILQLLACFAIPSVALTWWLVDAYEWTLFGALCLFFFECPFFGAALVTAAGHRVFGEEFSPMLGIKRVMGRFVLFTALMTAIRFVTWLASFMMVLPAYLLGTRYGFLAEILYLENCPAKKYESRLSDLMSQTYGNLLGRLISLAVFFSLAFASVFFLIDFLMGTLFNFPFLYGRIYFTEYFFEEFFTILTYDPRLASGVVAVAWLIYPVTRLAWMFCYLDVRIRQEGWDVELDFRIEAQRLEETP